MSQRPGPPVAENAQSLLRELGGRAGQVRDRWRLLLAAGLVLVALGLAVLAAGWSPGSLAAMTGLVFIVGGAAVALNPAYAARTAGEHVLAGIAAAAAGLVLLAWPGATGLVVVLFAGVWLAAVGGFQVVLSAARRRELPQWTFTLALGAIQFLLGLWAMRRPGATWVSASTVIGVWAAVAGVIYCVLAFEVRPAPRADPGGPRRGRNP